MPSQAGWNELEQINNGFTQMSNVWNVTISQMNTYMKNLFNIPSNLIQHKLLFWCNGQNTKQHLQQQRLNLNLNLFY